MQRRSIGLLSPHGPEAQRIFPSMLFSRIVPTLQDIGLFGDKVQAAFADLGVLGYSAVDVDALMAADEGVAGEVDRARRRQVAATIAAGATPG